MEYFILRQYERINNYEKLPYVKIEKDFFVKNEPMFYFIESKNSILSFLQKPFWLVSQGIFNIFRQYQVGAKARLLIMKNKESQDFNTFYFYKPYQLNCLHQDTEFYPNNTLKRLVLSEKLISSNKIFSVNQILEKYLIIDLEIAELLYSSGIFDFKLEKVETF